MITETNINFLDPVLNNTENKHEELSYFLQEIIAIEQYDCVSPEVSIVI